ncbi:unnamed protein product, partial [Oikopleura dioica]
GEPYDCRIDNYGVGLVAYFLSSGTHPFDGLQNFQEFIKHVISNSIDFDSTIWSDREISKVIILISVKTLLSTQGCDHLDHSIMPDKTSADPRFY